MRARVNKLLSIIKEDEAVFISSYPNIFYYSGFTSGDAYLLITHNKNYIITDSRYFIQAREEAPHFELYDISNGLENLFKKISEKIIGYEEFNLTVSKYEDLLKYAPRFEFVRMQKDINSPRRIKDSKEVQKIAKAQKICDDAFLYILDFIKPGVTEKEVALNLELFMKKNGAKALSFETISASGIRSAMPHGTATDKVIENGDFLTLDYGCVYEGYCSDMTRTVGIGNISDKQKEIYEIVLKAQLSALTEINTDTTCANVDLVARNIISEHGYGENFGHGLGHSVGVEIHENPSLSPKCKDKIENGMVLTVEPGIYIDGFCGVRIEDLIVVDGGKARNLTNSAKELIIL